MAKTLAVRFDLRRAREFLEVTELAPLRHEVAVEIARADDGVRAGIESAAFDASGNKQTSVARAIRAAPAYEEQVILFISIIWVHPRISANPR